MPTVTTAISALLAMAGFGAWGTRFYCKAIVVPKMLAPLAQEVQNLKGMAERGQKYQQELLSVEREFYTARIEAEFWEVHKDAYCKLIRGFELRQLEAANKDVTAPAGRTISLSVQQKMRAILEKQSGLPMEADLEEPPPAGPKIPKVSPWRRTFEPPPHFDYDVAIWEFVHRPTFTRLKVCHSRHAHMKHWLIVAQVVSPEHLDDHGQVDALVFQKHCREMRNYLSFDLVSDWEADAAITLAKTWVERTLVGERVGFFTPFNTIEDIVEPD